jgi:hypothetical protein
MKRALLLLIGFLIVQSLFIYSIEVRAPRDAANTQCLISYEKSSCDCCCPMNNENNEELISVIEMIEQNLCSKIELIDECDYETIGSIIDETRGILCSKIDGIDFTCSCECNEELISVIEMIEQNLCSKIELIDECQCETIGSIIDDLALKVCVLSSALDCLCVDRSGFGYIAISNILDDVNSSDEEVHAITIRNRTMFDGNPNTVNVRVRVMVADQLIQQIKRFSYVFIKVQR